jgi:hypothetical protein
MNPTERFTGRAAAYVAGRPGYPAHAIDAVLARLGASDELVAADFGAGTGIGFRWFRPDDAAA